MTQLPEPNFIERDADKITREWIALYEQKTGKVLQPAQIERLMIDVGAYRENTMRIQIQEVAKKNLLSYAPLEILEHIGEPLDVKKLEARCAKGVFRFNFDAPLDFDFTIPKGCEIETKDGLVIFETVDSANLKAGQTFIDIIGKAQIAGILGNNYDIGAINNLITPLAYVASVSNLTVSSGGADDEEADSLRERIRQAPEKFSNAGSKGAYKFHTLSAHQSIIDVAITSPSPGVVNIYPLTSDGNPSPEILKLVQDYLSDEKIRPLTDFVVVHSPQKIEFSIKANIILYKYADAPSVIKTIEAKMREYKIVLAEKLGKDIVTTQIISILNNVYGVFKVDLITPKNIDILENQWADLTNFEITIGGYANE